MWHERWHHVVKVLGVMPGASVYERAVAILGGFLGIFLIMGVSGTVVGGEGLPLIVASMGASAVLLFAVPSGPLSQPWPLVGGNLLSAIVGVTCAQLIPNTLVAAALAVGLAIGVMHCCKCIHPPGGATALTAVVGGAQVRALGYAYVVAPVLLNVLIILVVALVVNALLRKRCYPAGLWTLAEKTPAARAAASRQVPFAAEDLAYALRRLDVQELTDETIARAYALAVERASVASPGEARYHENIKAVYAAS